VADVLISYLYGTVPSIIEAYFSLPLPVLKADFFRYLILLACGGIYADIDTVALKPDHLWLPPTSAVDTVGLIIGIEADPTDDDWHERFSRRIQFCQWVMQAKVGHPVLRETVVRITEEALKRKREGKGKGKATVMEEEDIIEWTGPALWTDAIFWGMNRETKSDMEEWSWVQFTGITEPRVPPTLSHLVAFVWPGLIVANWRYPRFTHHWIFAWDRTDGEWGP